MCRIARQDDSGRSDAPRRRITTAAGALLLAVGGTLAGAPAQAHHSFAAVYNDKDMVTVTGTVTKIEWVNPHSHVLLDSKAANGTVRHWAFELHSQNDMMRSGWRRDTLKPGDVVTVRAARERSGADRAFLFYATFPNGRKVLELKDDLYQ